MHAVILGFISHIMTYICWRPKLEAISGIWIYDSQGKRKYVCVGGGLASVFFNTVESPDASLTPGSSFFRGFHSSLNSDNSNTVGNILWKHCPSWTRDRLDLDLYISLIIKWLGKKIYACCTFPMLHTESSCIYHLTLLRKFICLIPRIISPLFILMYNMSNTRGLEKNFCLQL